MNMNVPTPSMVGRHAAPAASRTSTAPVVLDAQHIEKVYGSRNNVTRALDDVSFKVTKGEFVAIMGPSGSGKSTLLNCVSTIDQVTSGSVIVGGADVTKLKSAKLTKFRREQLGFIFQDSNLLDTLTARENIALPLTIARVSAKEVLARVEEVALRLGIAQTLDKYPYQLSGGQQQRVAIARALAMQPDVMLFDEPDSALDYGNRKKILSRIAAIIKEDRYGGLITIHDPDYALHYCDEIIILKDGVIRETICCRDVTEDGRRPNES